MPLPKIEIQDIDHVFIDGEFVGDLGRAYAGLANTPGAYVVLGRAIRIWHQRGEDKHQEDRRVRSEKHAAEIALLVQQHAEATQQAEDKRVKAISMIRAEVNASRKAHSEWRDLQEDAKKAKAAEHEAALSELSQKHAKAVSALSTDLEISRTHHRQLREAVKELGDTPTVLALAAQARREWLSAELDALNASYPALVSADPVLMGLYRATDGRLAKVIRQLPGVVFFWLIDDPATSDDPIGKIQEKITLDGWRAAGFTPYDGG